MILCFAPATAQEGLQIDGASVSRGDNGALDVVDARVIGSDIDLAAGRLLYDPAAGFMSASGGVRAQSAAGMLLEAAEATYRINERLLEAPGQFTLQDTRGAIFASQNLFYSFADATGSADSTSIVFAESAARIAAERIRIAGEEYIMEEASYTTCKNDDPDWLLVAGSLGVDAQDDASATNVRLLLNSVPVFYFPYVAYPLSERRKSGFLPPSARLVGRGKSEIDIPYYLNLAPNYDMVVGARLISERGPLWHASGRLLGSESFGDASFGYIDDNSLRQRRYAWKLANQISSGAASFVVHGEGVSDDEYPADFDEGDATAQRHFLKSAALNWQSGRFAAGVLFDDYQTIAERPGEVERPYARLPELFARVSESAAGADVNIEMRFTDFASNDEDASANAGSRISAGAAARLRRPAGAAVFDLAAGVRAASYSLAGASGWLAPFAGAGFSYEMERNTTFSNLSVRQSLTPRMFLGVLARRDFSAAPVYDTARADLSVEHLYEVNPFVGGDRFGDASFVTFGIETGAWDSKSHRQLFEARFAQRYLLSDARASAGRRPAPASGLSNALADLRFSPNEHLTMVTQLEWNPRRSWEQVSWEGKFSRNENVYALRYALAKEDEEDDEGLLGASILHRLDSRRQILLDIDYSVDQQKVTAFAGGLQMRAQCGCWELDVVLRRELVGKDKTDSEILIQLSLAGLTDLGSRHYANLKETISERL